MSWDWVGDYPIFVYTRFLDHFKFEVKIVKGKKGDQNAEGCGPTAKPWMKYVQHGLASKREVVEKAIEKAIHALAEEGESIVSELIHEDHIGPICNHCGKVGGDHYPSCTPIYPENPDLSDEDRRKHGLLSHAEMEYWERVTPDVHEMQCDGAPKLKMIDATPPKRLPFDEHVARTCPICRKLCSNEQGRDEHMRVKHAAINANPEFNF